MELVREALQSVATFNIKVDAIKIISTDRLEVNGQPVKMNRQAFKDLVKMCGLSQKVVTQLNQTLKAGVGYNLIKEMIKALGKQSGRKLSLLICQEAKEVKRIAPEGALNVAINPETVDELVSYTLEKNNRIKLTDTFIDNGGTTVSFNLVYDSPLTTAFPNEEISLGKQVVWDMFNPTQIYDMVERLICTNGMVGVVPGDSYSLDNSSTPSEWYTKMYHELSNPSKDLINRYEQGMLNARQNNLSVFEFNEIKDALKSFDADQDKVMRYLGDERWKKEYEKRAINLDTLTHAQQKNCPTPINAWDGINALTDLASHTYNSVVPDRVRRGLQRKAARFLNGVWDETQQMLSVPRFSVEGPQQAELVFSDN